MTIINTFFLFIIKTTLLAQYTFNKKTSRNKH